MSRVFFGRARGGLGDFAEAAWAIGGVVIEMYTAR